MREAESAIETRPVIHVCVTCSREGDAADARPRAGRRLFDALTELVEREGADVVVSPVECLANCRRACSLAYAADGKWTYLFGDLDADAPGIATDVLACADVFAQAPDGIIPRKSRPASFDRTLVARVPPLPRPEKTP